MKCNQCENQATYSRKYSGQSLCSECFSQSILRKTAKTISKYKMIEYGQKICIGVSGGKDSLALLYIMNKMSQTHHFEIEAATIDEGIPGYRNEALGIVEQYCSTLDVKHRVYSYSDLFDLTLDEALKSRGDEKTTSCAICGTLRRRALDAAAQDMNADVVATAHNLDDAVQTFLINIISGDTERIIWQDPNISDSNRIKPFCEIYEKEIVFYAFTNQIPFQTEPCPHMNEGIRTQIRNFLNSMEDTHSGIKNNLYRSALKISAQMSPQGKQKSACVKCGSMCTSTTCSVCQMLKGLHGIQP
ncbi:MAG: PP-loop domain-containing protein [Cenarchaeum symbiont of Oopsacas minuta]|nr:PP-loop domain-containing protein [Cenarchaeum symbiont of Oopsacas minuta]